MARKYSPFTVVVIHLFDLQGVEKAPGGTWAKETKAAHRLMSNPDGYPDNRVATYTAEEIKDCLDELFRRGIRVKSLWMLVKWSEILESYRKHGRRFVIPDKFMEFHDRERRIDEFLSEIPPN